VPAPSLAPPDFDLAAAYPEVADVRAALAAGDWPALRASYLNAGWVGRSMLAGAVAESPRVEAFLRAAHSQDPTDTVPATLLAAHLIAEGWAARTAHRAAQVSAAQFATLRQCLNRSEQLLIDVTARQPGDVTAWSLRLTTAMGLELGQAEARRRYDRAVADDPHNVTAQRRHLQQICPKWGGSFEQAHAFARQCVFAAPAAAHNGILIVDVHLERWLDLSDATQRKGYFAAPMVQEEIRAAAQRSAWHPEFARQAGWVQVQQRLRGGVQPHR
jgi:hypothetical protein